mmetsp:Transcript_23111/g.36421  ORF Transcript_23111/g.36421 Transcript_23111/m.36421 type:complete len:203 (+) Transcript_23111:551-1159(+)
MTQIKLSQGRRSPPGTARRCCRRRPGATGASWPRCCSRAATRATATTAGRLRCTRRRRAGRTGAWRCCWSTAGRTVWTRRTPRAAPRSTSPATRRRRRWSPCCWRQGRTLRSRPMTPPSRATASTTASSPARTTSRSCCACSSPCARGGRRRTTCSRTSCARSWSPRRPCSAAWRTPWPPPRPASWSTRRTRPPSGGTPTLH